MSETHGQKHTKKFILSGKQYVGDGVYFYDELTSGSYKRCCIKEESDEWLEYDGTDICMYDSKTDEYYHYPEPEFIDAAGKYFWKDLFSENDYGPESHRIINGRRCVYWTDDIWISKRGIEKDESE